MSALDEADLLRPADWPAACGALMSTRRGGISAAPFDALDLKFESDDPRSHAATVENRRRLQATMQAQPVYLAQVHGVRVVRVGRADVARQPVHEADACITTEPGVACTVMVADCLPVLLASRDGRVVGAAHAGWRGLAGGVLEATVAALCDAGSVAPAEVVAWMGACIGPTAFEVGAEVRAAFHPHEAAHFVASAPRDGVPKWHADLAALAAGRLRGSGLGAVAGSGLCTFSEASRFFSYRRDGRCGRMAAAAWIREG